MATTETIDDGRADPSSPVTTRIVADVVAVVVLTPAARGRRDYWRVLTLMRGDGGRCPGSWEIVHGRIEPGERPGQAAIREVFEETGYVVNRLYSITTNPFYVPRTNTVHMAIVFAAIVDAPATVSLGSEHCASAWRTPSSARKYLAWPRDGEAIAHAITLLKDGTAGPVEDALRIL